MSKVPVESSRSLDVIEHLFKPNEVPRGYQARLAEALHCNPSHLSKVLKGRTYFTLEQAADAARFWQLDELETLFFVTLVAIDRAGTEHLKSTLLQNLILIRDAIRPRMAVTVPQS